VEGIAAGTYGAHVHRTGRCEGPAFDSAGAHWNPTGQQHGFRNPSGRHRGDLPNLVVGAAGRGTLTFTIRAAQLRGEAGMIDADGAALMIHAQADDYRTDPSGNSGPRIACGVLN
jgi:Cu-Zn family superoxide dismutase